MIRFYGAQKLDMLVTPEHRMVVYPDPLDKTYANESTPVFKQAQDLNQKDRLKISVANWNGASPTLPEFLGDIDACLFAEWLGFYIAEGCCAKSENGGGYCHWKVVVTQVKQEGVEYAESLYSKLPFKFFKTKRDFVVCSKDLWKYLEPFGNCYTKYVPQWVKDSPQGVIEGFLRGYFAGDGSTRDDGYIYAASASKQLIDDIQELLLRVGKSGRVWTKPPCEYEFKSEGRKGMRGEMHHIAVWRTDRATLRNFKPSGNKRTTLLYSLEPGYDGTVYCATVPNGTLITRRNGKPIISGNCIGYDQKHIGQTIHRLLLEPGLFQVIRDEKTGEWRQYKPWIAADAKRAHETRPAEPLIPERFIENITWVSYGQKIFEAIYLKNGNKICAYASTGEPKQGDAVDIIWIDEDVLQSRHIGEWQARLSDRKGRLFWSAFPHSKNNALVRMSERAAEQAGRPNPDIEEVVLKFRDNPWIDAEEKRKRIEGWSAEEARARDLGEFTYDTVLMYDWSPAVQGVPNAMGEDCPINRYWEKHRRLPDDWTRYLVLDPGHTTTAIMFAAVPPPVDSSETDWGDVVVIEDELYMHKATCSDIAREVQQKVAGRHYEAFIIDMHAGRQTPMGGAETIKAQYARAFENKNIKSARTGSTFINGSDNTTARREILRTWMQPTERGGSRLRIVLDKCPFVQRELKTYRKRITSDNFIEDEPAKSPHDAIDGLEYLAAFNPRWVRRKRMDSPGMSAFKSAKKLFMGLSGKDEHEPIFLGAGKG